MITPLNKNNIQHLSIESHLHCVAGCEKAVGEWIKDTLRCTQCGALFVECTPEICGAHK